MNYNSVPTFMAIYSTEDVYIIQIWKEVEVKGLREKLHSNLINFILSPIMFISFIALNGEPFCYINNSSQLCYVHITECILITKKYFHVPKNTSLILKFRAYSKRIILLIFIHSYATNNKIFERNN